MESLHEAQIAHCAHEPLADPRRAESADQSDAVQTLREAEQVIRRRASVWSACVFSAAFPKLPRTYGQGWFMGRSALRAALGWLLALWVGCASPPGGGGGHAGDARGSPDELHLFGVPVTLDLDQQPGSDGFAIRIYASSRTQAKGIPLRNGSVEISMFDGVVSDQKPTAAKPRRVWTFPAGELKSHLCQTAIGTGYQFALRWEDAVPAGDRITVVARYTSPQGRTISSGPSTIARAAP